jgi:quercetin dioxygenase-like cupin family protein
MGHASFSEKDLHLIEVAWGKTVTVFGPENVGAQFARVKITEYGPGMVHKKHRHPGQEEIMYVLEGRGISRTESGDQPMTPGTFVFIPADMDHVSINLEKDKPLKAIIIKSPPGEP